MPRSTGDITVPITTHKDLMATSCPGLFRGMYLKGGVPWVEPTGDTAPEDEGFVDLEPEDEQLVAEVEAGNVPDPEADAKVFGPDEDEVNASGDEAELPEADDEFDEDLGDVLADIKANQG